MKASEIRKLSAAEMDEKLAELKKELFNLRFQQAVNQLDNPMRINAVKKDIARILGTTVSYLVDGESIDAETEEAAKLIMMISDSKLRRAAIEQIRVLANM